MYRAYEQCGPASLGHVGPCVPSVAGSLKPLLQVCEGVGDVTTVEVPVFKRLSPRHRLGGFPFRGEACAVPLSPTSLRRYRARMSRAAYPVPPTPIAILD